MFKANYKIFDKTTGTYCSTGYKSKATWSSLPWTILAAKNIAIERGISNIEIHEFPVASAIVHMLADLIEKENEK